MFGCSRVTLSMVLTNGNYRQSPQPFGIFGSWPENATADGSPPTDFLTIMVAQPLTLRAAVVRLAWLGVVSPSPAQAKLPSDLR